MKPPPLRQNSLTLGVMLLLASGYIGWMNLPGTFTGSNLLDGILGVLLGLYIGSHPAANALDLLLFIRPDAREKLISIRSGQAWLGLNLLALVAGWLVIFTGITRLVASTVH